MNELLNKDDQQVTFTNGRSKLSRKSSFEFDEEKSEKEECLLNQTPKQDSNRDDLIRFYGNIHKNGGMIFHIGEYTVVDKDKELRKKDQKELLSVKDILGYTYNEILVLKLDAQTKKGYVIINDEIDIPLANLEPGIRPKYFFSHDEALKEWKRLSEIQYEYAEEAERISKRVKVFLRDAIDNNKH